MGLQAEKVTAVALAGDFSRSQNIPDRPVHNGRAVQSPQPGPVDDPPPHPLRHVRLAPHADRVCSLEPPQPLVDIETCAAVASRKEADSPPKYEDVADTPPKYDEATMKINNM